MKSLSIRIKILFIALIALFGMILNLSISYSLQKNNNEQLQEIEMVHFPVFELINSNLDAITAIRENFSAAVSNGESDIVKSEADKHAKTTRANFQKLKQLDTSINSWVNDASETFDKYFNNGREVTLAMVSGAGFDDAIGRKFDVMNKALVKYEKLLNDNKTNSYNSFTQSIKTIKSDSESTLVTSIIVFIISVGLLMSFAHLISSRISKSIGRVSAALHIYGTGNGDLTRRIEVDTNDEVGTLVENFNKFLDSLQTIIQQINSSILEFEKSSSQMSLTLKTQETSRERHQQQIIDAVSLAEGMMQTVQSIEENAEFAAKNVISTNEQVTTGYQRVENTISSINSLSSQVSTSAGALSSVREKIDDINSILETIRGISEQTNLLALNAAIEAARAGEQGRGFAVVADEVRTLAGRVNESTHEINTVIDNLKVVATQAFEAMSEGESQAVDTIDIAEKAGEALDDITRSIANISEVNSLVANASTEQTVVTENIRDNIKSIGDFGTEVAQDALNNFEASEKLSGISQNLKKLVGSFKV